MPYVVRFIPTVAESLLRNDEEPCKTKFPANCNVSIAGGISIVVLLKVTLPYIALVGTGIFERPENWTVLAGSNVPSTIDVVSAILEIVNVLLGFTSMVAVIVFEVLVVRSDRSTITFELAPDTNQFVDKLPGLLLAI